MNYQVLDEQKVVDYLKTIPQVCAQLGDGDWRAKEIGDGNLNYVWIVENKADSSRSVVLKQALPYLRCVGEEYPLGRERMTYEIRSMLEYEKITPLHVPKIHHTDEAMSLMVMQNLSEHVIMRKGILKATGYPKFVEHISDFLSHNLFKTSSFYLDSKSTRERIAKFTGNTELCELTEHFVFTYPYMIQETNKWNPEIDAEVQAIRNDSQFKQKVQELKFKFINRTDALIHGDLHTGSIMLNGDETYVIDSEFAFYGPMGFDIGAVFGNLLMAWASYAVREDQEYRVWLLESAFMMLENTMQKFRALWDMQGERTAMSVPGYWEGLDLGYADFKNAFMKQLLQETIGFAGCKMMRRQMGIAHVLDIDSIEDPKQRAVAEKLVIRIAREFVVRHGEIESLEDVKRFVI